MQDKRLLAPFFLCVYDGPHFLGPTVASPLVILESPLVLLAITMRKGPRCRLITRWCDYISDIAWSVPSWLGVGRTNRLLKTV